MGMLLRGCPTLGMESPGLWVKAQYLQVQSVYTGEAFTSPPELTGFHTFPEMQRSEEPAAVSMGRPNDSCAWVRMHKTQ